MGQCHRNPPKRYPSSSAKVSVSRPAVDPGYQRRHFRRSPDASNALIPTGLAPSDSASMKGVPSNGYFLSCSVQVGLTPHNRPAKFSNISSRNSRFCVKTGLECRRAN